MKKTLVALMLGLVSIAFIGCSSPERKAVEKAVLNEDSGFLDEALELQERFGDAINVKTKLSEWNDTPIDVQKKSQRYEALGLWYDKTAKDWYDGTVKFDSAQIEYYTERIAWGRKYGITDSEEFYKKQVAYYTESYETDLAKYNYWVAGRDSVNALITTAADKDEDWRYVYEFTVQTSYKHPITDKVVNIDVRCFAYFEADGMELVMIDEEVDGKYVSSLELH